LAIEKMLMNSEDHEKESDEKFWRVGFGRKIINRLGEVREGREERYKKKLGLGEDGLGDRKDVVSEIEMKWNS